MVIRICPNCNKVFNKKSNYLEHINPNRKFPCVKVVQNGGDQNEINDLKEKIIETYKTQIEFLKKENEYLKDQLEKERNRNKNSINITNNHNTVYMVNYIMKKYTESPPIEVKNDYLEILGVDLGENLSKSIIACNGTTFF
mgnify:FL=1